MTITGARVSETRSQLETIRVIIRMGKYQVHFYCRLVKTELISSPNSESLLSISITHLCLAWPTFGMTFPQASQRRKRLSNLALGIPSGLNNSETMETTSTLEASEHMFEDDDGSEGGETPDATINHVATRCVSVLTFALSLLFLADAVNGLQSKQKKNQISSDVHADGIPSSLTPVIKSL